MMNLDATFQALSDPTRREILAQLRDCERATLSEIAEPFEMSLPGVMKHVAILETAGLLEREKIGRSVYCKFNPKPMSDAIEWLRKMEAFWDDRLAALAKHLDETQPETASTNKISKSGLRGK